MKEVIVLVGLLAAPRKLGKRAGTTQNIAVVQRKMFYTTRRTPFRTRRPPLISLTQQTPGRYYLFVALFCLILANPLSGQAQVSVFSDRAWQVVEGAIRTGNPGEQELAVLVLEDVRGQRAKALVREAVKSPLSGKRAAAIRLLGASPESADLDLVADSLKDGNALVRSRAAEALPQFQDVRALELLGVALEDKDFVVTGVAHLSAQRMGQPAAPVLIHLLQHSANENTRAAVAASLAEVKSPDAIVPLRKALGDPSASVRGAASLALLTLGDSSGIDVLRQMAASPDTNLIDFKVRAMVALCALGERTYLDMLRDVFVRGDERLQVKVLAASRTAGSCPVRSIIEGALAGPYGSIRSLAMDAIAASATAADMQILKTAASSNDEAVRFNAARTLVMLGDMSALPIVTSALRSSSPSIRAATVRALAAAGDAGTIISLQDMLDDENSAVRLAAIEASVQLKNESAVSSLEQLVAAGNMLFSGAAANALVALKGDAALPFLFETLQSPNSFSRILAAGAILKRAP